MKKFKSTICYFSPAGTTKKVADFIAETLTKGGHDVESSDLSVVKSEDIFNSASNRLKKGDCLWIGSPVYACHIVPPVEDFLSNLPKAEGAFAVPFVTYGAVTSGIGLYEMARLLTERGYRIPGAAKILAVHSLLWSSKSPLGNGHPGPDDEKLIKKLIESVSDKISNPDAENFADPEVLNYQPGKVRDHAKAWNLAALRQAMPPTKLDDEKCTECGICAEKCPVQNISLNPLPKLGDNCLFCFNCIRYCDPGALTNESLGVLEGMIRDRVNEYGEPAETKIFI
ncbi:EFR1 family ferrodoxin [Desulfococcaceae bacterium HSG8]|nr:EFR1 family ferrodoxin [Desulfococcaceae bacterium HSG8]